MSKKKDFIPDCKNCEGECCSYVTIQIDEPEDQSDYETLRWYLLHENVHVFKDEERDWYVEVKSKCKALGKDNQCRIYDKRPEICRDHGLGHEECEFYGDPYEVIFTSVEELEKYLKKKRK
ncbi:YkgJ family cysteine cluster protein [bacterium]